MWLQQKAGKADIEEKLLETSETIASAAAAAAVR